MSDSKTSDRDCLGCLTGTLEIEERGKAPPIGHCDTCGKSWYLGPGSSRDGGGRDG